MIPSFTDENLLPEGIHEATWSEVMQRFGTNPKRKRLLEGLGAGLQALQRAGCVKAYLDGSFVTAKPGPGDFDVCYESAAMDFSLLEPTLKDFSNRRTAQKQRYGGEFFEAEAEALPEGTFYLEFFQMTKDGRRKGIIALDLAALPKEVDRD